MIRHSRTLTLIAVATLAFVFLGGRYLLSESSQLRIVDYLATSRSKVDEIYGLIHLVTGGVEKQHALTEAADADPTKPVDLSVYAEGKQIEWRSEVKKLDAKYPVVVFSKVISTSDMYTSIYACH